MKLAAFAFIALTLGLRADEKTESVISKSHEGVFQLIETIDQKQDLRWYTIREAKTLKEISDRDDPNNTSGDDYLNPGFGAPSVDWSPTDSRMLIITSKLYRDRGDFSAVFRITNDLKLVRVQIPDGEAIPARWNPDGTLVISIRVDATFKFDPAKNRFQAIGEKPSKKP